jgi:hypothetical protein
MNWPQIKLADVLDERKETPSDEGLNKGDIKIIEKIGFATGEISLRGAGGTKTKMSLVKKIHG